MHKYKFIRADFNLPDADNPEVDHRITLSADSGIAIRLVHWYESTIIATYIMDNFATTHAITEDIAMNIAAEIRYRMNKFGETMEDATLNVINAENFDPKKFIIF